MTLHDTPGRAVAEWASRVDRQHRAPRASRQKHDLGNAQRQPCSGSAVKRSRKNRAHSHRHPPALSRATATSRRQYLRHTSRTCTCYTPKRSTRRMRMLYDKSHLIAGPAYCWPFSFHLKAARFHFISKQHLHFADKHSFPVAIHRDGQAELSLGVALCEELSRHAFDPLFVPAQSTRAHARAGSLQA